MGGIGGGDSRSVDDKTGWKVCDSSSVWFETADGWNSDKSVISAGKPSLPWQKFEIKTNIRLKKSVYKLVQHYFVEQLLSLVFSFSTRKNSKFKKKSNH